MTIESPTAVLAPLELIAAAIRQGGILVENVEWTEANGTARFTLVYRVTESSGLGGQQLRQGGHEGA